MNNTLTVQTVINAPVETVWKLYTTSEHITQWNHASDDWHSPQAENDLRAGGKFSFRMEAKDGSAGFDFSGTYEEVQPNELLAYSMDDNRKVTVVFTPADQQTKVEVTFEAEEMNPLEMQRGGWQAILDNFKDYVEARP